MKKIALLLTLLAAFSFPKAQGLQFSQVLAMQVSVAAASGTTVSLGTVPAGKVWKLENVICYIHTPDSYGLVVNGASATPYRIPTAPTGSAGITQFMNNSSLWFPAGTTLAVKRQSGSVLDNLLVNILEFTVVP